MRSTWSLSILLLMINVRVKKIMVDSVRKDDYPYLAFRSLSSTFTQIINTFSSKYIPLTIIGVVNNLSPLIVVLMAFIFLTKDKTKIDFVKIYLS